MSVEREGAPSPAGDARGRGASRVALAALFVAAGTLHFVVPPVYEAVMPPYLPLRRELVLLSGGLEILGGAGLLAPSARVRRAAGWGLAAFLVAVFPANVHMAINEVQVAGIRTGSFGWWLRLPFQPLLIWWALWATGPRGACRRTPSAAAGGEG